VACWLPLLVMLRLRLMVLGIGVLLVAAAAAWGLRDQHLIYPPAVAVNTPSSLMG
jgi:hypothetical protein